ncbi:hypothetical protein HZH68_007346 [Vespula germanica]|uniref:Cytochrome c oxidase subunit VIb n=1 Tax=Vespula germanica TaxID=30212 RepID=A0A834K7H2_VESGE|nr:hypothetical protein HZH68_007346 [Vespula germanica]
MVLENDNKNSDKTKDKIILPVKLIDDEKENVPSKPAKERKKITIEVYEDDPCLQGKIYEDPKVEDTKFLSSPGLDPRFQQQNQTLRCYVMYTDFYRCEHILGEGHEACAWFKRVFTSICPNDWINNWDELRTSGRLPWHKYKTQGNFPGDKYGMRISYMIKWQLFVQKLLPHHEDNLPSSGVASTWIIRMHRVRINIVCNF